MSMFWVMFLVAAFVFAVICSVKAQRNKKLIAVAAAAEIEHKEWLTKRRANMTQSQRDSEDFYYSRLRNAPESERFKQRTGNSSSKDLLGFDLLPK